MPPPFKKGQIVICTDDVFTNTHGETLPKKGINYTIRDVINKGGGKTCLRFTEIVNNPLAYDDGLQECSFNGTRFKVRKGRG